MNWKKLENFIRIAEYKSINQAAKALDNSQSNLSRIIMNLEKSCGQTLVERHSKGIKLTNEGLNLLKIVTEFNQKITNFSKH